MIGIYLRVSTDEQRDKGHSIAAQLAKSEAIIKEQFDNDNFTIYNDAGYSAKNLNRPNMKQLIIDITEQKIDTLIFYSLDRISRNLNDLIYFLHHAETNGCQLICITQSIAYDTPEQRMMVLMQGVFAQFEREKISERTKNGLSGGFEKGQYVFSNIPYGYTKINKTLVINVHQAEIVQKIYYLYLDCSWSIQQIFQHLKKYPIDPGTNFYYNKIQKILTNTIYVGYVEYQNKVYDNFPAIVSRQKWNRVQDMIHHGMYSREKQTKHTYIFKRKVKCSHCGRSLTGQSTVKKSRTYLYYFCNNKKCKCYRKRMLQEKIAAQLENVLITLQENFFEESKKQLIKKLNVDKSKEQLQKEIKIRKDKIEKLNIAYLEENITSNELRMLKKKYNNEIEYYQTEIDLLLNSITKTKDFKSLSLAQQQQFVQQKLPIIDIDLSEKKALM